MTRDNKATKKRDREVTRAIHKLFWRADMHDKYGILVTLLLRVPALVLIHISLPLAVAYCIEAIVNRQFGLVSGYVWQIIWFSLGFAVLWGLGGLVISRSGVIAGKYLQRAVFENYMSKDFDFYGDTYFGSLGAQASRLREALNEYNQVMLLIMPAQLVINVAGIIVIASKSIALAVATLIAMALVLSITMGMSTWRLKYRRKVSESNSEIAGLVGDALTQAPAVKSFAAEDYEKKRLDKNLKTWGHNQFISWALATPADAIRAVLAGIATATLLIMTASLYERGEISIAIVALVQLYVIKMIASTLQIAEMIKTYEQLMGGAYQPVKTMLITQSIKDKPEPLELPEGDEQPVTFKKVTFRYPDATKGNNAIKDFSLTVSPGEKIGLVGYSGSGKTTLTKLLLRFMDVDTGSIAIGDRDIRDVRQSDLRRHIAYVPQEPLLFHRSIRENIGYGNPDAPKKKVMEAARMAYVDEFTAELPAKYETFVGERGVKLSGGQRQRVAIARAILKDAPILLLDEATSALDSRSEQLIQKALWRLMKGRTALVIAHRLSTIHRMDRIVVMDKGRIAQIGTHQELLKDKKGIYAELWAHQSGGYIGLPPEESDVQATPVNQTGTAVY